MGSAGARARLVRQGRHHASFAAGHLRRRPERVQHRLLGRVDDRLEERRSARPSSTHPAAAENATKISPLPWCATEPVRARPSPARRATRPRSCELERRVDRDDDDAAACRSARSSRSSRAEQLADRRPRPCDRSRREPKFARTSAPTVPPSRWQRPGSTFRSRPSSRTPSSPCPPRRRPRRRAGPRRRRPPARRRRPRPGPRAPPRASCRRTRPRPGSRRPRRRRVGSAATAAATAPS